MLMVIPFIVAPDGIDKLEKLENVIADVLWSIALVIVPSSANVLFALTEFVLTELGKEVVVAITQ